MSTVPPPGVRLFGLIAGFMRTQAIGVFAELGVADAIAGGTTATADLAAEVGADADALGRVLRVLEAEGVVAQDPPGSWRLTEVGELLRDGVPGSMRHQARMFAAEQYEAWADAAHSVRTGKASFPHRFGEPYFAWLRDQPEAAERFDRAMAGTATVRLLPLLDRDWSDSTTVVDVGGGNATLLERLLGAQPHLSGTSFDLPDVSRRAAERVAGTAVADRLATAGGDFFAEVPAGADAYVLAQILHDWDDADAVRLLAACRRAAAPHTRLLVLEQIVPEGPEPSPVKLLDLHMLVLLAGRERTQAEFESVFAQAGWHLAARADGPRSSLLEAVPG